MESLLTQRMRQRNLTAVGVSNMMRQRSQRAIEYGDHLIPRAYSARAVSSVMRNPDHFAIGSIVDAIDSALPPLTPQHATSVEVGSEDRIAVYAQRFARGEALFHCDDISHYNNGEQL